MTKKTIISLTLCLLPLFLQAEEDTDPEPRGWFGEGALSYTSASGNTDSENLNASLNINRESPLWKHKAAIESLRAEADGVTSSDSLVFTQRSQYTLSRKSYAFGQLRHENDDFAAFTYRTSVTVGAGTRLLNNPQHLLDVSLGPGYRKSKTSETGETTERAILASNVNYEYTVSDTTTLTEALLIEGGEENTYTESRTSLTTRINKKFATRMSYLIKHNSTVPSGTDKTDEIFSISLVYGF